jgi:hypothetical protein
MKATEKNRPCYPEYIVKLMLNDFENYLKNGLPIQDNEKNPLFISKFLEKIIFDGSSKILKWYKNCSSFYILGLFNLSHPDEENIIIITNDAIINAYKGNIKEIVFSEIKRIDIPTHNHPIIISQEPNPRCNNIYFLEYRCNNTPKVVEIDARSLVHVSNSFNRLSFPTVTIPNQEGPLNLYFKNVSILTGTDFVATLDESETPIEVTWTGIFKFPILEVINYGTIKEIELNISIFTEVKSIGSDDGKYLHFISTENALKSVKKYLTDIFENNEMLKDNFYISFLNSTDNKKSLDIVLAAKLKTLYSTYAHNDYNELNESVEFTPITVSHPFAVELGLRLTGLDII